MDDGQWPPSILHTNVNSFRQMLLASDIIQ
jgi:hypothetical protein